MYPFTIKVSSENELIEALKNLKNINALGQSIIIGTYVPNNYDVNSIINSKYQGKKCNYFKEFDIFGISVGTPSKCEIEDYPQTLGKNNVSISLCTNDDIDNGDYYKKIVSVYDLIDETTNFINSLI